MFMIEKESTQPRTRGRQRSVKTSSKTVTSLIEGSPQVPSKSNIDTQRKAPIFDVHKETWKKLYTPHHSMTKHPQVLCKQPISTFQKLSTKFYFFTLSSLQLSIGVKIKKFMCLTSHIYNLFMLTYRWEVSQIGYCHADMSWKVRNI